MNGIPIELIGGLLEDVVEPEALKKFTKKIELIQQMVPQTSSKTPAISYDAPKVDTSSFIVKSALLEMASEIPDGVVGIDVVLEKIKKATMWSDFEREFDVRMTAAGFEAGQLEYCLRRFIIFWNLDFRHTKLKAKDSEADNPRWTASLFQTIALKEDPIAEVSIFTKGDKNGATTQS